MSNFLNKQLNSEVVKLVSKFFPQVNLRLIFDNPNSISKFFPFKDVLPLSVRSNIVYRYTCGICYSTYIGESTRHFSTRVAEHRGVSSRTELPLKNPKSNIYSHFLETVHLIQTKNFAILQTNQNFDLKISESIAIHKFKPDLNGMVQSVPLNILR